jgi:hypothetical protein
MKVIKRFTVETMQVIELLVLVDKDTPNAQIENKLEKILRSEARDWFEMNAPPVTATTNPEVIALEDVPKRFDVWEFANEEEKRDRGLCEVRSYELRAYLAANAEEEKTCKQEP